MSAAHWRKAMNSGAGATAWPRATAPTGLLRAPLPTGDRWDWWARNGSYTAAHAALLFVLVLYPLVATRFFTFQIGAQSLALGLIALSLTFLNGYGGMVSLAQMTVAGVAGYMVGIFGASGSPTVSLGWPWWLAILLALPIATLAATFIGWLSVRTAGICTIMITLAIGVAFFYLVQQNYSIFNGFQGIQQIRPPVVLGIDWREPVAFYFLCLFWSAAAYAFVVYLRNAPFGLALQGIRDNPRRMNALGFYVTAHRVASYAVAGLIAAIGGVLMVWYNGLITPGSVGTSALINILIIAVLGGMRHPLGAFIGAVIFVLLQNFAVDIVGRERFNLLIGGVFLAIVLFSPDGVLGWWSWIRAKLQQAQSESSQRRLS